MLGQWTHQHKGVQPAGSYRKAGSYALQRKYTKHLTKTLNTQKPSCSCFIARRCVQKACLTDSHGKDRRSQKPSGGQNRISLYVSRIQPFGKGYPQQVVKVYVE